MALTLTIGVQKTQVFHTHLYGPRVVSIYVGGDTNNKNNNNDNNSNNNNVTTASQDVNEAKGLGVGVGGEEEVSPGCLLFEKEFDIIPEKGWEVWKKSRDAFNRLSKADQAKCCVAATRG